MYRLIAMNYMDNLVEARANKTAESLSQFQQDTSMIEDLLSAYNNNHRNLRVVEYISRQNLFDMIGKGRNEMVHSRMIAELLGGRFFDVSNKSTLMHFFDIIIMRAKEQGIKIPHEFVDAVLTRSIDIDSVKEKQTEYPLSAYLKDYGKKSDDLNNKQRLDVFLRYNLATALKKNGNKTIEIIIENKVLSKEHDRQTQTYYDICSDGRRAIQLFVYLSPISQRDLLDYSHVSDAQKPVCTDQEDNPVFVHISYQDIFDRIIAPLIEDNKMNERDTIILKEYASCLELPAMSDKEINMLGAKELSIMAISDYEKQMLSVFMENTDNARLLGAAVANHLGNKLYSYNGTDCLTFNQALQEALRYHVRFNSELSSMKQFKDVIGAQKGGARFLIYVVKESEDKLYYIPTFLFEYNGKAYKTITDALKVAVKDYISRTGKSTKEVIKDFEPLYAQVKYHPHLFKDNGETLPGPFVPYYKTDFADLYIRGEVYQDKLRKINSILGDGFGITLISEKCYHELVMSGDDSLWECYDKHLFEPLQGTRYYYRKNAEDRIEVINDILSNKITESSLSEADRNLLETFYQKNKKLILSVYRILMENEQDTDSYERRKREYQRLIKD